MGRGEEEGKEDEGVKGFVCCEVGCVLDRDISE